MRRQYLFQIFYATGRRLLIKFNSPSGEQEPTTYVREFITSFNSALVDEVSGRDLVCLTKRNTESLQDEVVDVSLRRCDRLKPDVVWDVLGKVIQSNAIFGLTTSRSSSGSREDANC